VASGGSADETVGAGTQAFRTFLKRLNAALKRPRVGRPVRYVPDGPADAPDRYGGLYVLRRFVTPDTIGAVADAAVADAARRGRTLNREAVVARLAEEATAGATGAAV
jgi:hypothetical protein